MLRVFPPLRAFRVAALAAACASVGLLAVPSVASAHTDVDYTLPADGEQAPTPVEEITVAFDDPVTLVGAGFEVLTPAGAIVVPSVFSEDGAVYFLEVAEPLAGGVAAVRYEVSAADGHVLEGGFSFTVPAAVAPPTTAPPTGAPTAAPGATTQPPAPVSTAESAATTAPQVVAPAPTEAPTATIVATDDDGGGGSGSGILIGVVAAVAVAGIAFLLLRSRMSSPD